MKRTKYLIFTQRERDLMTMTDDNPFLIKLFYSFQDEKYLHLVMEYYEGGDLIAILMREDILTENKQNFIFQK